MKEQHDSLVAGSEHKTKEDAIQNPESQERIVRIGRRGYDVIRNSFFVEEEVACYNEQLHREMNRLKNRYITDFEAYYDYLDGAIYDYSCYYKCDISKLKIRGERIYHKKLAERDSFIVDSVDNYRIPRPADQRKIYEQVENQKEELILWINKINACTSVTNLEKAMKACRKAMQSQNRFFNFCFFMWQFIFFDIEDTKRREVVIRYLATIPDKYFGLVLKPLCYVYNPKEVISLFENPNMDRKEFGQVKKELTKHANGIGEGETETRKEAGFDKYTHFYFEKTSNGVCRYFETFDELVKYRNYDLTNSDLGDALHLEYDFSQCKCDETTILPHKDTIKYCIKKRYAGGKFAVKYGWFYSDNTPVDGFTGVKEFDYFCDFVTFLKGDLSDADLLMCPGLININDFSGINLKNARLTSVMCEKLGIEYKTINIKKESLKSFIESQSNEANGEITVSKSRENYEKTNRIAPWLPTAEKTTERISYVTDIHVIHKLEKFEAKSENDVIFVVQSIVSNLVRETDKIMLIGGDVSADFDIFVLFVSMLRAELDKRHSKPEIFFVLGNHELWSFQGIPFERIVDKYRELLNQYGMHLLQNEIIYRDSEGNYLAITREDILNWNVETLREKTRKARVMLFGGLAFSGCNESFNANNGIYDGVVDRKTEIEESSKFDDLYRKVCLAMHDKQVIIFTHMPVDCWHKESDYQNGFIYVSGHTHKEFFYDDGEKRVYADNQIGYGNRTVHMKCFDVDLEYDLFADYSDGIYNITSEDYMAFYRGKNILMTFNRSDSVIMLKKNGYYCFILRSANGNYMILNGGSVKTLEKKDVDYYYNKMDDIISSIQGPLSKYTAAQKSIAQKIIEIGGEGRIHGCIIDVDWNNHIFLDPSDGIIMAYWASDIVHKKVYSCVQSLLKEECPLLYAKYERLICQDEQFRAIWKAENDLMNIPPQEYLDTKMYKASREIKKMQRLESNILTTWIEPADRHRFLGEK